MAGRLLTPPAYGAAGGRRLAQDRGPGRRRSVMGGVRRRPQAAFTAVTTIHRPVSAAVTGLALGGGLELAVCATSGWRGKGPFATEDRRAGMREWAGEGHLHRALALTMIMEMGLPSPQGLSFPVRSGGAREEQQSPCIPSTTRPCRATARPTASPPAARPWTWSPPRCAPTARTWPSTPGC